MSILKFKKTNYISLSQQPQKADSGAKKEKKIPELWMKCDNCGEVLLKEDVKNNKYVCYKCGKYFRLRAKTRIKFIADQGSMITWDEDVQTDNPLDFPGYEEKLAQLQEKLKLQDAVITGECTIESRKAVLCACDGRFMMGSMGYVVGEKITRAIEKATEKQLPVVIFACSGGARMQEGIISLMQMAKTSAALKKHADAGLFYLSVLTDPTTGGVTASYAMLGDIILAEPGALVGFAGPRVIEQTIRQKLPDGFQRAEFLVEHGLIDGIVKRENMKETIAQLIDMHAPETAIWKKERVGQEIQTERNGQNARFVQEEQEKQAAAFRKQTLDTWQRVEIARSKDRPTALDYIEEVFEDFYELHGDRRACDDGAVIGGIAYLDGKPVTVIGQQKGRNTKENIYRNFGMPSPEGYIKALRLMKQAEKFRRPVIAFIDTPGAFCGMEAEEHGQGQAIAQNLFEMAGISVPILSIVIGEGGSGGALALGVGNEVWMMENATYSVLSPEGFASILWKDSSRASEAAEVMKMTAADLYELQVIDDIIEEETPANVSNIRTIAAQMKEKMLRFIRKREKMTQKEIVEERQKRFRVM
ncbi:MAG: acetyl-CoA carboxylase carboxyltransferase subunit beta [Eubacterium sp.]|nr:acetyl-CoA carboxylase carboxyltransferase subunit beta [Eubacterium sp.]